MTIECSEISLRVKHIAGSVYPIFTLARIQCQPSLAKGEI